MIEPTGLRMGNIVLLNGAPFTIVNGCNIDEVCLVAEGIPITDELLADYGYMVDFISQDYTFYAHPQLTVFFKLCKFDAGGIKVRLCFTVGKESYSPNLGGWIKYLHELQNLHYYSTKTELTDYKKMNDQMNKWAAH